MENVIKALKENEKLYKEIENKVKEKAGLVKKEEKKESKESGWGEIFKIKSKLSKIFFHLNKQKNKL